MSLAKITANQDWTLSVVTTDGGHGRFDLKPYLQYEAFEPLHDIAEFLKVRNGGYFVEWECGADLSADTIEARMAVTECSRG